MHNKKQNISKVTRKLISYFRDKERVGSQQEKDSVWSRIEDEVKSDPSDHKLRKLKYLISIAASAAVIAGACWILKDQLFTLDSDHIRNVANTSILDSEDVVLIVSDKKQ